MSEFLKKIAEAFAVAAATAVGTAIVVTGFEMIKKPADEKKPEKPKRKVRK